MSNTFKNTALVTKFIVKAFLNALVMGQRVDRQLDESRVFSGKIGAEASIRRPVMFEAKDGATLDLQDIEEGIVLVKLDIRKHVGFTVTSEDLALRIEDAESRYITPAAEELAQVVETAIGALYPEIPNFVGVPGTEPSTFLDIGSAGSALTKLGVPIRDRAAFWGPDESLALSNGLKGVFVQEVAKTAIEEASFGRYGKFDNFECTSLAIHVPGVASGTPLVDGDAQNVTYLSAKDTDSQTIVTKGWSNSITGILKAGDVITFAGVNAVNRRTRTDTGNLATFTVLEDADSGITTGPATLSIGPPIITSGPYQTVTAAPADDAIITVLTGTAGESYRQNIGFHRNAITLAFGQLDVITDGAVGSRQNYKGVSIKTQRQYSIGDDSLTYRFDILFGLKMNERSFAVRITS